MIGMEMEEGFPTAEELLVGKYRHHRPPFVLYMC